MSDPDVVAAHWLTRLREALQEPAQVPPHVVEGAYAAFSWRTIDAELAELTYDSSHDRAAATVRSEEQAALRALTFVSASLTVELEVDERRLMGQLVPPQQATVTVVVQGGPVATVETDQLGCFLVESAPDTVFRLRVVVEDRTVETDWVIV
jgi:hypothetical protein